MGKVKDITGQKFNRLTAIKYNGDGKWLFKCECGKEIVRLQAPVKRGNTKSCGCYYSEKSREVINNYNETIPKTNEYEVIDGVAFLKCRKGKVFKVDEIDLDFVLQRLWSVGRDGYVMSGRSAEGIRLHSELMKTKKKVDHKNGDPSDNRRCNLRIVTDQQNAMNRRTPINNTTGVKGVTKHNDGGYVVRLGFMGKRHYLGYYKTFEEAVKVRNEKEKELYKEFMRG